MAIPATFLLDNGSLEPASTLALRELAMQLSRRLGHTVEPVSLLHSNSIDPAALGGQPAEILVPALERRLASGQTEFVILPLFFGPSRALTDYLPEQVARLREKYPVLNVRVAAPIFTAGDDRLVRILADHVHAAFDCRSLLAGDLEPPLPDPSLSRLQAGSYKERPVRVALVDHGSPVAAVTAVRNDLARQLAARLGERVVAVAPCSMERRPDPAYDFNEPLLAKLLATPPWSEGRVIVAMQFLLPGRHAGPEGDVAGICRQAQAAHPSLRTKMTALVGSHPLLLEILADRWGAAKSGP